MEETQNPSFDEFAAAFDDDYQITEEHEEVNEEEQNPEVDEEEEQEAEELEGEDPDAEAKEEKPEEKPAEPETFTLKVNKEERTVSRDEVISLAQKGADYDRVKEQLAESKNTITSLQERIGKYDEAISVLEMISATSGQSVSQLAENLHLSMLMKGGKSEAEARAELRALKAEAQLKAAQAKDAEKKTAQEDSQARANREVAEFHKKFPGVELTEALCNELMTDVRGGMSITEAYMKRELAKKEAEMAEIKRQQAAEAQNKKNRATAIGSQKDSGGRRQKTDFDDFMSAFA